MTDQAEIGARVRRAVRDVLPDVPQAQVAERVEMTPDSFSRALNGKRSFSALELARLADLLDVDIYQLITGQPDPQRLVFAARHSYDAATGARDVPGSAGDSAILRDIELAYRQAGPLPASSAIPATPELVREALGPDFVRPFADRVEAALGIDVIRVSGLSTAYCSDSRGRRAIVVPAVGNWFRENWDIAHELGHLGVGDLTDERATPTQEAAANAFAAELLLPSGAIDAVNWSTISESDLAQYVWAQGVSTTALVNRLTSLRIPASPCVAHWAQQPTQRLLRYHWQRPAGHAGDPITQRMAEAAARRFPLSLEEAHLARIASGELGVGTLAWMLGVPPATLEVDAPPVAPAPDVDVLATELGLRPVS